MGNNEIEAFENMLHSEKKVQESNTASEFSDEKYRHEPDYSTQTDNNTRSKQFSGSKLLVMIIVFTGLFWTTYRIKCYIDSYQFAAQTIHWPATEATVLKTDKKVQESDVVDSEKQVHSYFYYQPIITYRYKVHGVEFTSSQYSLKPLTNQSLGMDAGSAKMIIDEYKPGLKIWIYYNPKAPNMAVILPGNADGYASFAFLDLMIMSFTVWLPLSIYFNLWTNSWGNAGISGGLRYSLPGPGIGDIVFGLVPWIIIMLFFAFVLPKLIFR